MDTLYSKHKNASLLHGLVNTVRPPRYTSREIAEQTGVTSFQTKSGQNTSTKLKNTLASCFTGRTEAVLLTKVTLYEVLY